MCSGVRASVAKVTALSNRGSGFDGRLELVGQSGPEADGSRILPDLSSKLISELSDSYYVPCHFSQHERGR